ncbi:MAG TPA: magnesium transporter [Vicinamibacterales bacterium]|nr:magnesium transporter [Vicinamibacterales bacterium]
MRVILSSTALLSFISVRKAAGLAVAQLGVAAFFVAGTTRAALGDAAPWFVLAAAVAGAFVRAIDIESWALLIPGGVVARVQQAFGRRAARGAAAAGLVERLLLAALASVLIGQYAANIAVTALAGRRLTGYVRPEDLATLVAVTIIGSLWLRTRVGRDLTSHRIAQGVWIGVGFLAALTIWGFISVIRGAAPAAPIIAPPPFLQITGWYPLDIALVYIFGVALALPAIGGGDAVARAAHELRPPRLQALQRTSLIVSFFAIGIIVTGAFLYAQLVPAADQALWSAAPLAGVAQHLAGPSWARDLMAILLLVAAVLLLVPAVHAALSDAEQILQRLSIEGAVSERLAFLHTRFGTPSRAIDGAAAAAVMVMVASGGRVTWLAHGYAMAIAATLLIKVAALVRLRRRLRTATRPFRAPLNLRVGAAEVPLGLAGCVLILTVVAVAMVAARDAAGIAVLTMIGSLTFVFTGVWRGNAASVAAEDADALDVLPAAELSLDQMEARPGNVLVLVRNPYSLAHVAAALQTPRDRDVVAMTVRLLGIDVTDDRFDDPTPTAAERRVLSEVATLAERHNRPIRLLVVPARDVFDAIVSTILRLRSSDVHVGESSTLSADDQSRLLGDAWERAAREEPLDVRLVVHHRSGRTDTYHLGAHPPSLSTGDLDLIHRLWLDATKAIGPHVHHHDVVRAALTQMEQQLNGPQRDEALAAIRQTARPAEELAPVLRARDYAQLRDMMRNRHAGDVAELLTELSLEDQVVVFRVLPRKDAAAVFEYMSQDAKTALLKAMAKEDVAALLNNMAPDERTMFLEELPATATRELLTLLTPGERAVAVTLLGYPERSVGRLMTPHYVAVREHWTVLDVLDHVRRHGQDSETLNVIYVVDEQGLLIDDVRIREFLLAPVDHHVADLMDRRFVALKATDDQEAAVAIFRQYDRTALPVTDTGGMLIGIVTIDDVLDVAEATATREIQRIGGSEALDEPYMSIAFGRMIQKRAGWLTALFLGEMLTATAMGAFEQEISKAVVLALFVPLIISSGGNSGSQAATLVIRALALGEVGLVDWWRVMRREIFAGLALGAILGTIGFLRITVWSAFSDIYGEHWMLIAITVAVSLIGVVLWGTLTGSLLPLLMRRLGFDPAASSAPFVATLVDVTGLVIYFTVATMVLRGTLL